MSNLIADTRHQVGFTQRALAERAGVTPGNVSQWEQAERDGRITLATLQTALQAMGHQPVVTAQRLARERLVLGNLELFNHLPANGRGTDRAMWRAKQRIRTAAITYDALAEGTDFTLEQLWVLAEGITVKTRNLTGMTQVWDMGAAYDQAVAAANNRWWKPSILLPNGITVTQRTSGHPVAQAVAWAAGLIGNGMDPLPARYLANTSILRAGYDWIMLGPNDRTQYNEAIGFIKLMGNPDRFYTLMAARYNEQD